VAGPGLQPIYSLATLPYPGREATVPARQLLITADDFGIGPETTRGILEVARRGTVTSTVLLVNSPFAESSIREWDLAGRPVELGWHPCLTLDSPILSPNQVPSLVGANGRFHNLGQLMKRIALGRLDPAEVRAEFHAQLERFIELVGFSPVNVNAHHHIHVFRVVVESIMDVVADLNPKPFIRRVTESKSTLWHVSGARLKRAFLAIRGRSAARRQDLRGFPGNQTLLGVTDPQYVSDPEFFIKWLSSARGELVELACHPGFADPTLAGRDDDPLSRRPHELDRLMAPEFLEAVEAAGFKLVTAKEMAEACQRQEGLISRKWPKLSRITR
jgi:predicted glycoside hydrolase/deacetylase ChbG (UPF0249 family)